MAPVSALSNSMSDIQHHQARSVNVLLLHPGGWLDVSIDVSH